MNLNLLNWPKLALPLSKQTHLKKRLVTGPWTDATRVVVVCPWFAVAGRANVCARLDYKELERRKPQVIAAPIPELRRLTADVLSGTVRLPPPERGIVALTGVGRQPPTQQDVDMVWLAFQTPLRSEFRSWTGRLLASDCEMRCGLHVRTARAVFAECQEDGELRVAQVSSEDPLPKMLRTGIEGKVETAPCPCGDPSPRLVNLRPISETIMSTLSATA